jgi:hypothetical protein
MTNPDPFADSCAVLIGVSAYEYAEYPPIRAARNSLKAMRALLSDPELCGWPPERIKVISNPISVADLGVQIADLAENTVGVMVLYYVGHGVLTTRGELCLTVTSTRPNRPKMTGLAWADIADVMRTCPARVRITILDCCFAGQAIESLAADDGPGLADITHVDGVYTLTATTRNHTAHVPPPHQQDTECTSFTSELLDLIRSGIPHKPQWLTLGDIYPILRQRLLTNGLPAPNQRGTDTVLQFPFTVNAATQLVDEDTTAPGDRRTPSGLERPALAAASVLPPPVDVPRRPGRYQSELTDEPALTTSADIDERAAVAAAEESARLMRTYSESYEDRELRNKHEAFAAETANNALSVEAFERSGQGSRVVEIDMPRDE